MPPVRVMLVIEATAGGTARYLEAIVPAVAARELDVHVVCSARRDPVFHDAIRRFREAGARVTELPMVRGLSPLADAIGVWRLLRLVRRCRPDVVHLHSSKAGGIGRLAAACGMAGTILYTPHAFAFLDSAHRVRSWFYLTLEKLLARWTDVLVAVSESEARTAIAHGLASAERTCVVPNAVSGEPAPRRPANGTRRAGDRVVVGALGRMEEQKDPMRLVELASRLASRKLQVELRVGGTGPLLEPCRRRARMMGLEDRIRFIGHVADPAAFYASLDIFVLTSRYEGSPYTVLDAMLHRLPIAAFDVPGVRDLVGPGATGLLVPPGDVSALAGAIASLAEDPALAERLGAAGAARIESHFRLERQVDALVDLYRRCAAGPRS